MHRTRHGSAEVTGRQALALAACLSLSACLGRHPARTLSLPAAATPLRATPAAGLHAGSRPPTAAELRTIRDLMGETERIRGLTFLRPVDVRIQDRQAMRAYVSAALDDEDLARTRLRYVALGLLAPDLDVRALIESLMEEELVGYYDPDAQRLAIRDDVARAFARSSGADNALEWRATVVHELVHALQDQHLGLGPALDAQRTTDADNAFGALVEGDATLTMLAYAAGASGVSLEALVRDRELLTRTVRGTPETLTGSMRSAPAIVREPLLFRYREGALFVASLAHRGGFSAVDAAHGAPPTRTREILEPARFFAHERALDLALPGLPELEASGHHIVDEDSLGRFELGIYLGPGGHRLASAWVADRYAVFERAGRAGCVWVVRFATAAAAKQVEEAVRRWRKSQGARVERTGAAVLITRGVTADAAPGLASEFRSWARSD